MPPCSPAHGDEGAVLFEAVRVRASTRHVLVPRHLEPTLRRVYCGRVVRGGGWRRSKCMRMVHRERLDLRAVARCVQALLQASAQIARQLQRQRADHRQRGRVRRRIHLRVEHHPMSCAYSHQIYSTGQSAVAAGNPHTRTHSHTHAHARTHSLTHTLSLTHTHTHLVRAVQRRAGGIVDHHWPARGVLVHDERLLVVRVKTQQRRLAMWRGVRPRYAVLSVDTGQSIN